MKKVINKPFVLELEGQEVDCILHSFEVVPESELEEGVEVGYMSITIGDREAFDYAIWGDGLTQEECCICLPTMLEDSDDDELETYSLDVMLDGVEY